eukprot:TRINITY_DN11979_c0_g1_i1.p1 TRINITY_DN11979_c0_g1~~TRINITY_DN11979_c0_g1_i1.p1  ORF type:complete len:506 (+),score=54.50 TRINITY_DN11979_c0_g1_i1:84-1601(+)
MSRRCRLPCPTHICGIDVDELFAYTTTKYVRIHDARLGLLHYFLLTCIVLYIVVYKLIGQLGYLKFEDAANSVRMTLQQPVKNGCNPNDATCQDDLPLLSHLPYCCATNSSCKFNSDGSCNCDYRTSFKNYNCTYMDGSNAAVVEGTSIMVTTLTHDYKQTLNPRCFDTYPYGANSCSKIWNSDSDTITFVAAIQDYTVLLDHSVFSPATGLAVTSREMQGYLFVDSGSSAQDQLCASRSDAVATAFSDDKTDTAPCYVKPQSAAGLDFFSVGTLLQAMGVSLEDASYEGSSHSARYEGLITTLVIEYENTQDWHGLLGTTRYTYKPQHVPASTYKTTVLMDTQYPDHRVKRDQHGVLFVVKAGGQLAVFDFTQLLLQLTTSLALLALATLGVNMLAQYVLRHRRYYNEALYDRTADFGHLSFIEAHSDSQIDEELRRRRLGTRGSRTQRVIRLLEDGWSPPHDHRDSSVQDAARDAPSTAFDVNSGPGGSRRGLTLPIVNPNRP